MALPAFILNDETVYTSHGFYLLNAGARLDRFRENPVMLDNHCDSQVIGRWKDLHMEGARLMATPDFDAEDEVGKKRQRQVEKGFVRGASLGLYINAAEYRIDPATGESRLYVTEWEALEASIVAIPSNAGAVSLRVYNSESRPMAETELSVHLERIVKLSKSNNTMSTIKNQTEADVTLSAQALVALGVSESATTAEVSAAVVRLSAELEKEKAEHEALKNEVEADQKRRAEDMVELAVKDGRITADRRETFVKLALADFKTAQETLETLKTKESLSAKVQGSLGGGAIPEARKSWNLCRWMREDMEGLNRLKADAPEAYAEILKKQ